MACDDRQISQAQREAGYNQQRTGVVQALRPFSGAPTLENLLDYLNRELVPAVRATRNAANDIYLQVADNAPSANPLAYYFSTNTAASDPTTGRIKLNASPQDTATIIRVSESNARLQSVIPWLDVMSGGPTTPLGTVTLVDAINPGRFLRFDLNTMTDQGAYWDLGVTFIEGSHDDPFVQDEAVVLGFISGVSAAGSTVPVGSLSPIARDTFIGNIGTTTAPPVAVPLADVDSTSIVYDATSHTYQRAALTGAIAASANSNATLFSGIRNNGSDESDRTSLNFISTTSISCSIGDDGANDELELVWHRAALTGAITASLDSNATRFAGILDNGSAESDRTSLNFVSSTSCTLVVTDDGANDELEITAQRAALTGEATASANNNAVTVTRSTNFQTSPWTGDHQFNAEMRLGTLHTESGASGALNITLTAGATRILINSTGAVTLGTISGCAEGRVLILEHVRSSGAGNVTITHDTSTNGVSCPLAQDFVLGNRCEVVLVGRANVWRLAGTPETGKLVAYTEYNSGSGTHTYNSRTTFAIHDLTGGGGAGGGVSSGGSGSAAAGGGQAGGTVRTAIAVTPGSSADYEVGDGGTGVSGGAGNDGGGTTMDGCTGAQGGLGGQVAARATTNSATPGGGDNVTGSQGAAGDPGICIVEGGTDIAIAGKGGDGPDGGGGWVNPLVAGPGTRTGSAGRLPGAGGSGASNLATASNVTGGAGRVGRIRVWEFS